MQISNPVQISAPIEELAWIRFPSRCYIAMANYPIRCNRGILLHQAPGYLNQCIVLCICEPGIVGTLQLDTNGIVVAVILTFKTRFARMPGFTIEWHILSDFAVSIDQQVRRHTQLGDFGKKRMDRGIQAITEQVVHKIAAELTRRQADIVDYQQVNLVILLS